MYDDEMEGASQDALEDLKAIAAAVTATGGSYTAAGEKVKRTIVCGAGATTRSARLSTRGNEATK